MGRSGEGKDDGLEVAPLAESIESEKRLAEPISIVGVEEYGAWSHGIDRTTNVGKTPRDIPYTDTEVEGSSAVVEREFFNIDQGRVDGSYVELNRTRKIYAPPKHGVAVACTNHDVRYGYRLSRSAAESHTVHLNAIGLSSKAFTEVAGRQNRHPDGQTPEDHVISPSVTVRSRAH